MKATKITLKPQENNYISRIQQMYNDQIILFLSLIALNEGYEVTPKTKLHYEKGILEVSELSDKESKVKTSK